MDTTREAGESSLGRWRVQRRWALAAAVLAAVLSLPSLWSGWALDDLIHRTFLLDGSRFPWDLYGFLKGDPEENRALITAGSLPWWALEDLQVSFFRPFTSLTFWLDYRLWPNHPALMHAHSVLWLAGCVGVAGLLYRRFMGPGPAAVTAVLLFAVDDAHTAPVGWLANRNALPAFFFGALAILAHDRWRRDGWRGGRWMSPVLLLAAVCSAEAGVAALGYLLAYVVVVERAPWVRRPATVGLHFAVLVGWRVVYSLLGHGTWGSGFYTDPGSEPLRFGVAVLTRAPILLLTQWVLPPMSFDGFMAMFGPHWGWTAGGVVAMVVLATVLLPVVRDAPMARFWALGMLLALPPVCATIPMSRLLMFVGLGAMALLAQFLTAVFSRTSPWRSWPRRVTAVLLVLIHGLAAPVALALQTRHLIPPEVRPLLFIDTPMDAAVTRQKVVVVSAPSVFHARHSTLMWAMADQPVPREMLFVCPSWAGVHLSRPDRRTLVVRPDGGYLRRPLDHLFRAPYRAMPVGTQVRLRECSVEITDLTADGRPAEATFHFDHELEHDSLRWLQWQDGSYQPFTPPAVGHTCVLQEPP